MSITIQSPIKKAIEPSSPNTSSIANFDSVASYLIYLEKQTDIRDSAIKTAQDLIKMYKVQNESLKEENNYLRRLLQSKNQVTVQNQLKYYQTTLLKYSQRISDLLQNKSIYEEKINLLEKELDLAVKWIEKNHGKIIQKKKQKQYYRIEESEEDPEMSYLQDDRKISRKQDILQKSNKHKMQKMLEVQLKTKDQEVMQLLKRLHNVQERNIRLDQRTPEGTKKKHLQQTAPTLNQSKFRRNNSSYDSLKF